jgi:hypothetical protein
MRLRFGFGALATVFLGVMITVTWAVGSVQQSIQLGELNLPAEGSTARKAKFRKVVILRGQPLHGQLRATFRDGVSYLNGIQWKPSPKHLGDQSAPQFQDLSEVAISQLSRTPFVKSQHERGKSKRQAAQEFLKLQDEQLQKVRDAYQRHKKLGEREAIRRACQVIDPVLAVADPSAPNGPRFASNGNFVLHFHEFGPVASIQGDPGTADWTQARISLRNAKTDFRELRAALQSRAPALIIYGETGTSIYVGEDASRALTEVDALLSTAGNTEMAVRSVRPRLLGTTDALEIARHSRKEGR